MMFLRYCEREFDLDKIDMDKFQMNGKLVIQIEVCSVANYLTFFLIFRQSIVFAKQK